MLAIFSGMVGVAAIYLAVKISWLNWIVDGPGRLVSIFTPIDFHEGDGFLGFVLAFFMSWLWTSLVAFFAASWLFRRVQKAVQ